MGEISVDQVREIPQYRDPIIDAAKGFGILFVILGHLVYYDSPLFRIIFNFHMPLFFALSGMTFSPDKYADGKAILKRLWTNLGVPFVFFTLLGTVICILTGRFVQHSLMDWLRVGSSFVRGDPYVAGSLWFLTCLAVVKFLFWAWHRRRNSIRKTISLLIMAYVCGVLFADFIHPKVLLGGPLMCFSVPMAFFFFTIGYYSRGLLEKIRMTYFPIAVVLSLIFFSLEILLALSRPTPNLAIPSFPSPLVFLPASLCGICAVLLLSGKSLFPIRFIGRYSLYYFLMERWVREAWFAISARLMPDFISHFNEDNSNLIQLTGLQTVVTLAAVIMMTTVILPILRTALESLRHYRH